MVRSNSRTGGKSKKSFCLTKDQVRPKSYLKEHYLNLDYKLVIAKM